MFHLMLGFMALGMLAAAIAIGLLPLWPGAVGSSCHCRSFKGKNHPLFSRRVRNFGTAGQFIFLLSERTYISLVGRSIILDRLRPAAVGGGCCCMPD